MSRGLNRRIYLVGRGSSMCREDGKINIDFLVFMEYAPDW